jgi:hypothetical protein
MEKMIGRKAVRGIACRYARRGCTCFQYAGPASKPSGKRSAKRREQAEVSSEIRAYGRRGACDYDAGGNII